jgi:hypothetical protein
MQKHALAIAPQQHDGTTGAVRFADHREGGHRCELEPIDSAGRRTGLEFQMAGGVQQVLHRDLVTGAETKMMCQGSRFGRDLVEPRNSTKGGKSRLAARGCIAAGRILRCGRPGPRRLSLPLPHAPVRGRESLTRSAAVVTEVTHRRNARLAACGDMA